MLCLIKLSYFMRSSHLWDIARPSFIAGWQPHISARLQLHRVGNQKSCVIFGVWRTSDPYIFADYFNIYICLHVIVGQIVAEHGFDENIWTYEKVKWSRYMPGVAQRVGRVIALLFHDRGTKRGWVVSSTPRPHFTPGKGPVPILQEAGWAPGPAWTGGKSLPHWDSIPDRSARSQSLYRLS
jgi:hypothetical protein